MIRFLVLAFLLPLGSNIVAQSADSSRPRTMLKFLKPGDLIGVQSIDGTTSVFISIYTKERFEIAKHVLNLGRATMSAQQFAADNALIRKELEEYLARKNNTGVVEDKLMVMPLIRTSLGTIVHAGDDYVLIEFNRDDNHGSKTSCVIPNTSIGKIYLDANPIRFFGPRRSIVSGDRGVS